MITRSKAMVHNQIGDRVAVKSDPVGGYLVFLPLVMRD
jgi:hypothetical protein